MKRLFGLVLIVLVTVFVLGGCDNLFGSDDDDNGDDTTTEVPDTVPNGSDGAVTGESYGYMVFTDDVQSTSGGYATDVALYGADPTSNDSYDYLNIASLYDSTDSAELEAGEYTYIPDGEDNWGTPMTFDDFFVGANVNFTAGTADYAASPNSVSSALTDNFDLLTDGTITVSKDGDTYTIEWEMTTDGGETLAGSYTGEVNQTDTAE